MQSTMQTSQKPISPHGGGESTFFQEGSLANLSALPDNERERTMTVTSGLKCYGLYGRYSPLGSLARTLLASSRWYSPARRLKWEAKPLFSERLTEKEYCCVKSTSSRPSAETLEVKDIPSNRFLFRLVPSEHRTGGTGSGLLPTPTATDAGSGRINRSLSPNAAERPTIAFAAKMGLLPTPNASEGTKWTTKYNPNSQMGRGLTAMTINDMLPTPQARDFKGECHPTQSCLPNALQTSQLNPLFVAEMMGFPPDWTVLPFQSGGRNPSKPTATQ